MKINALKGSILGGIQQDEGILKAMSNEVIGVI